MRAAHSEFCAGTGVTAMRSPYFDRVSAAKLNGSPLRWSSAIHLAEREPRRGFRAGSAGLRHKSRIRSAKRTIRLERNTSMLKKFAVALIGASMLTAPVLLAGTSQAAPATTQTITVPATKASVKTVKRHRKHVRHVKVTRHKAHSARIARHGKAVKHARKMVRQPVRQGARTSKPAA
jgi:hypothetical protein